MYNLIKLCQVCDGLVEVGESKPSCLVIFDVEGVLLPKRRYLLVAGAKLGFWGFMKILVIGLFYEIRLLSLESALGRVFTFFRGVLVEDLFKLYKDIPLNMDAETVFKKLHRNGCKTALISSGLPTFFVKDLANRLNADYAFGLELETRNGYLTGKVFGDALKPKGKALILKRILEEEHLSHRDCIVVADDRNNLPMFPLCAVRIGYTPDFLVSIKSDFAIKGDLSDVLQYIIGDSLKVHRPTLSRNEIFREAIHLSGFVVPLVLNYRLLSFLNRYLASFIVFLITLMYVASEIARTGGTNFPVFSAINRRAMIQPEIQEFATDPIFFALGIALSLILFPEPICYAAIAILTLGDSFAMIFGRVLGRTAYLFNKVKSVQGSFFGFLFAFFGALVFVSPVKALLGAFIGLLVECLPLPISDNLTVPISVGLALMML